MPKSIVNVDPTRRVQLCDSSSSLCSQKTREDPTQLTELSHHVVEFIMRPDYRGNSNQLVEFTLYPKIGKPYSTGRVLQPLHIKLIPVDSNAPNLRSNLLG